MAAMGMGSNGEMGEAASSAHADGLCHWFLGLGLHSLRPNGDMERLRSLESLRPAVQSSLQVLGCRDAAQCPCLTVGK